MTHVSVHILCYGHTLCRNIHGLPKDWGPGHKWVRLEERELATCPICRSVANLLDAARAVNFGRHELTLPPPGPDDGERE